MNAGPNPTIDRPLLIVGCGRSGTTILYDVVCAHEDLAWFSNYTARWPNHPRLALLSRAYPTMRRLGVRRHRLPNPVPSEGHRLWDEIRSVDRRTDSRPLTEHDIREGERQRASGLVVAHQHFQRRPRFVNKNTRNVRRVRYLNGLFPDCLVIHVLRHPMATISSLLGVAFWPDLPVWCLGDATPRQLVAAGEREEVVAANLWCHEVQTALDHAEALPGDRYLEVRYENMVEEPQRTLEQVVAFAGLNWSDRFEHAFRTFRFRTSARPRRDFDRKELAAISAVVRPLSDALGYS